MRVLLLILAMTVLAAPASAAMRVCNKTGQPAQVALGFFDGTSWSSRGWWTVPTAGCSELIAQPLNARYYYLYAHQNDPDGAWEGDHTFCTAGGPFDIAGHTQCQKRGYQRNRFFEIDTGDSPDWTENLED